MVPGEDWSTGTIEPAPRAPATPFQAAANPADLADASVAAQTDASGVRPARRAGDSAAVEDAKLVAETRA